MDVGDLRRAQKTQCAVACLGDAVPEGEVLCQGIAHAHQHTALDLSLDGNRVDDFSGVMGGVDLGHPAFFVQNDHVGRVAVGDVAFGEGHVCAQLVGRLEIFIKEFPSLESRQVSSRLLQGLSKLQGSLTDCFAGEEGLAGAGGGARIRRDLCAAGSVADPGQRQARGLGHVLAENCQASLSYIRSGAVDDTDAVLDHQPRPALVRQADAHAGILHGAGNTGPAGIGFVNILYCQEGLLEGCRRVGDLSVGKDFARLDGVAEADLPGGDPDLFSQQVDHGLQGKFALADAEAPEGARGRIVGIVTVSADIGILVAVGTHGMGTGALQHRSAQGGIGSRVKIDVAVQGCKNTVFITAQGKSPLHGMALGVEIDGFLAAEAGFDRPFVDPGGQSADVLYGHVLLAAETAADQLVLHDDPLRIPAEHDGNFLAGVIDSLVRAQDLDAVFIGKSHSTFRFQEGVLGKGCAEGSGHCVCRGCQSGGRVAPGDVPALAEVARAVDLWRLRCHGPGDGGHRFKYLILHFDQLFGFLQDLLGLGCHQTDGIADAPGHAAHSDHDVPVLLEVSHLVIGHILSGQDAGYARKGKSC